MNEGLPTRRIGKEVGCGRHHRILRRNHYRSQAPDLALPSQLGTVAGQKTKNYQSPAKKKKPKKIRSGSREFSSLNNNKKRLTKECAVL